MMSAHVEYHGWMDPAEGQCMAIHVKDGPRCPNRAEYVATVRFPDGREVTDVQWCGYHAGGVRGEHPEQIITIRYLDPAGRRRR